MEGLRQLDSVAYIRFASVYRDFSGSAGLRGVRQQRARCRRAPDRPVIVLVRPQLGENIGKAARAMLNFGLTEMRLVEPRDGWPNPAAGPAAAGADEVLAERAGVRQRRRGRCRLRARLCHHGAQARRDQAGAHARSSRARDRRQHRGAARSCSGPSARGSRPRTSRWRATIVTVPVNPAFASLNLAQAVILCAYEWSQACPARLRPPPTRARTCCPRPRRTSSRA